MTTKKAPTPTYKIATYLPMALRRQMASKTYAEREGDDRGIRICKTGRCPMGWLFADPPKGTLHGSRAVPSAWTIARRIKRLFPSLTKGRTAGEIWDEAAAFVDAWDNGKIKSLHKALGVPK